MTHHAAMLFRLREIRRERGLTIEQLSDLTGLSKSFISQIETGKRDPGANSMQVFADALRVKVTDLLDTGSTDAGYHRAMELFRQLGADDMQAVVMMCEALIRQREGR